MANSPTNTNRLYDGGIQFLLGLNSNLNPSYLNAQQYAWSINTINAGGEVDCRPGYQSLFRLPDGIAQGCTLFTPTDGNVNLVMAVSGKIYVSEFPFVTYRQLSNVTFSPYVDQIVFKQALQSKDPLNFFTPKAILMMQDGITRAAYWDGGFSRHLDPGAQETVQGQWMEWIGNRLWVSRGRELFASDIFDPLHFTENTYLSLGGSLNAMDGDIITGLARTADAQSLLVFTIGNTTIVAAGISDRAAWKTTPNFITLLFPGVGCCAGKSIFYNDGDLWWFSTEGARNFTQVGSTIRSSRNDISSIEMKRSFDNISTAVSSRICGFAFSPFLGYSVPSGDIYNRHTWVMDTSTNSQLTGDSPYAWNSIWMGTRPVEWASGNIQGTDRCFYLSQDYCGVRLWEAFQSNRRDNGTDIYCSFEGAGLNFKEPTSFKKFLYSEYHVSKLQGTVPLTADYRSEYGCWQRIADITLCAVSCFTSLECFGANPTLKKQNRYFKTQQNKTECSEDAPYNDSIGTYFQNKIEWVGRMAIRIVKSSAQQYEETSTGACAKSDVECKEVACCQPERTYISHVNDCQYGYGSTESNCCNV